MDQGQVEMPRWLDQEVAQEKVGPNQEAEVALERANREVEAARLQDLEVVHEKVDQEVEVDRVRVDPKVQMLDQEVDREKVDRNHGAEVVLGNQNREAEVDQLGRIEVAPENHAQGAEVDRGKVVHVREVEAVLLDREVVRGRVAQGPGVEVDHEEVEVDHEEVEVALLDQGLALGKVVLAQEVEAALEEVAVVLQDQEVDREKVDQGQEVEVAREKVVLVPEAKVDREEVEVDLGKVVQGVAVGLKVVRGVAVARLDREVAVVHAPEVGPSPDLAHAVLVAKAVVVQYLQATRRNDQQVCFLKRFIIFFF